VDLCPYEREECENGVGPDVNTIIMSDVLYLFITTDKEKVVNCCLL
jgi:hypothetical protein